MDRIQVRLKNWPFEKDEKAQLVWIGTPFKLNNKIMINGYFKCNGKTKKVCMDWGTLPMLAIQHHYVDGNMSKSLPPEQTKEVDIVIPPTGVTYFEKKWSIHGTTEKDMSCSFIVKDRGQTYILPLIEVVRSILAPNRFLLYRLFETNSFPQYFIEYQRPNQIHLDFTSQYEQKYTKSAFLYHLVWLLTNSDIREMFENIAFNYIKTGALKFEWGFEQPISIRAIVKAGSFGSTILRVMKVQNKKIGVSEISFTHPELQNHEKSDESKKYTMHRKNIEDSLNEMSIREDQEGTTDTFDLIEMDQQKHEYAKSPKIVRQYKKTGKQRSSEDKDTKKYYFEDKGIRSTADVGGNQTTRGIDYEMFDKIKADGELKEFIHILKMISKQPQVKNMGINIDMLPYGGEERKFKYLSDGITRRKYLVSELTLINNQAVCLIEVEREEYSLSTIILKGKSKRDLNIAHKSLIADLSENNGVWVHESLQSVKPLGIEILKSRHSNSSRSRRVELLMGKISN